MCMCVCMCVYACICLYQMLPFLIVSHIRRRLEVDVPSVNVCVCICGCTSSRHFPDFTLPQWRLKFTHLASNLMCLACMWARFYRHTRMYVCMYMYTYVHIKNSKLWCSYKYIHTYLCERNRVSNRSGAYKSAFVCKDTHAKTHTDGPKYALEHNENYLL
jgi:hypothetical protein